MSATPERIVLTGAGGGIGTALGKLLVESGYDVLGLDRKPPTESPVKWKYADLADRDSVMRHLEGADAVVHLGEIPNMWGPFSPDEVYAQNTRVSSTIFQGAAYLGVNRIIYASTAQVYGSWGDVVLPPVSLPLDEDHPLRPQTAYALSKVANEGYLAMVTRQNPAIAAAALRFPGVIGLWWSWEFFVDRLKAHEEERDGLGTYIHVQDLCKAFVLALRGVKPGELRIYNVMADDVANLTPAREYLAKHWPELELPDDHPEHGSWASADRIKDELGWSPAFSVHRAYQERKAGS